MVLSISSASLLSSSLPNAQRLYKTTVYLVKFVAMITRYFKNTVLGKIFVQKGGIVVRVWSETGEFHNASHAANYVTVIK
jgi:hypothetical protein